MYISLSLLVSELVLSVLYYFILFVFDTDLVQEKYFMINFSIPPHGYYAIFQEVVDSKVHISMTLKNRPSSLKSHSPQNSYIE